MNPFYSTPEHPKTIGKVSQDIGAFMKDYHAELVSAEEAENFARGYTDNYLKMANGVHIPPEADLFFTGPRILIILTLNIV